MRHIKPFVWLTIVLVIAWMGVNIGVFKTPRMPWQETETKQQMQDDEIECVMYNVLVDMKAAKNVTLETEAKVIKTILNHVRVYKKRACDVLHRMEVLIEPGAIRKGVPDRQDWYMALEFSPKWKRKLAIREHVKELLKKPDPQWLATHYVRPDRPRTKGNQTADEIAALFKALDPVPKGKVKNEKGELVDDPAEEFQFFKPKR